MALPAKCICRYSTSFSARTGRSPSTSASVARRSAILAFTAAAMLSSSLYIWRRSRGRERGSITVMEVLVAVGYFFLRETGIGPLCDQYRTCSGHTTNALSSRILVCLLLILNLILHLHHHTPSSMFFLSSGTAHSRCHFCSRTCSRNACTICKSFQTVLV